MANSRSFARRAARTEPPLVGSELPRIWTRPLRRLTPKTSAGFEACTFATDVLSIALHPWQRWLLIHALELLPDGTFRFRTLVVLVARQNGKTTLLQIVALWRMFVDGAGLTIGTAQNLDVAEEAWAGAVEMAEGIPELASEIASVDRTNGKKALRLDTGERYKVAAASRRGGRGLSGDLVILDEIREHQSWEAWAAVTKTTMARAAPQIWAVSNAGDDRSVVLNHLHKAAVSSLTGGGDLGLFEWSAPPAKCTHRGEHGPAKPGCALGDPRAWVAANPSLGLGVTVAAIKAALTTDPDEVFTTEVLCRRVPALNTNAPPISPAMWQARTDSESRIAGPIVIGVDVNPTRTAGAVAVAGYRADETAHLELARAESGTDWIVTQLEKMLAEQPVHDMQDGKVWRPAIVGDRLALGPLDTELAAAGITPILLDTADTVEACARLLDAVLQGTVWHPGQPQLSDQLAAAVKRDVGDGGWAWGKRASAAEGLPDITGLVAGTAAHWALAGLPPQPFFSTSR